MALYQHPHLTRGVVHTPMGAFTVHRGVVDLPDDMGESLGWKPVPDSPWSAPADGRTGAADLGVRMAVRQAER